MVSINANFFAGYAALPGKNLPFLQTFLARN
jgi:hypothetical protein